MTKLRKKENVSSLLSTSILCPSVVTSSESQVAEPDCHWFLIIDVLHVDDGGSGAETPAAANAFRTKVFPVANFAIDLIVFVLNRSSIQKFAAITARVALPVPMLSCAL